MVMQILPLDLGGQISLSIPHIKELKQRFRQRHVVTILSPIVSVVSGIQFVVGHNIVADPIKSLTNGSVEALLVCGTEVTFLIMFNEEFCGKLNQVKRSGFQGLD